MRLLTLLILFSFVSASAQVDSVYYGSDAPPPRAQNKFWNPSWRSKVTLSAEFQPWFGNPAFIYISPAVGFTPVKNLNAGIGGIYNYTSINFGSFGHYRQSLFGGHTYARYVILKSYFVQTQFDYLKQPDWFSPEPNDKVWVPYLLLGGGFRHQIGVRSALLTTIMYNLTPHPLSIYGNRVVVQFGVVTGL